MKILGRIKKSKVLTAVMTAVLIFQSACPTGLAYAAQKSGETLLYSSVTVQLTDPSLPESCIDARAVCRIFSDGYAYERTFTLSMRGNTL